MTTSKALRQLLLAAALGVSMGAQADGSAVTASLTGIRFTLIDLDPGDGVTPSLDILAAPGFVSLANIVNHFGSCSLPGNCAGRSSSGPLFSQADADLDASRWVHAWTRADGSGLPTDLIAAAQVASPAYTAALHDLRGTAALDGTLSFVLSPNTQLVIDALGLLQTQAYKGDGAVVMDLGWRVDSMTYGSSSDSLSSLSLDFTSLTQRRTLTVGVTNASSDPLAGTFAARVEFNGQGVYTAPAAPVPEPQTWALMLAGATLVGWLARHRKPRRR